MNTILQNNPNQIEAYLVHGYYRHAIKLILERIERDSENSQWYLLAMIAASEGCIPDLLNWLAAKRKHFVANPTTVLVSRALTPGIRVEKAVQLFDQAIELVQENAHLYYLRGKRLREMGLYKKAINDFNTCLLINPAYGMAYIPRSHCYKLLGLHRLEMEDYHQLLNSMACNREEVHRLMFQCCLNIEKKEFQLTALDWVYRWMQC